MLENKIFEIIKKSDVEEGARIYGTKFVDSVKVVNSQELLKSRLVAMNYNDEGALFILTNAPKVERISQSTI